MDRGRRRVMMVSENNAQKKKNALSTKGQRRVMAPPITDEQLKMLDQVYKEDKNATGRDRLWYAVRDKFPGKNVPSQPQVMDYLKTQESWQIHTRPPKQTTIAPLAILKPGYGQCDLFIMSSYPDRGFRSVLVVIDAFTKKVFAEPLRGESEQVVTAAMRKILDENPGKKWTVIQSDPGSHFQKVFGGMLKKRGVTHFHSQTARPQSNAFVERMVGVVKGMLFRLMNQQGDKKWVNNLSKVVANINSARSFTTDMAPDALEKADAKVQQEVANRIMARLRRRYKLPAVTELLPIGQHVRVRRELGRLRKAGSQGWWSDAVFTVAHIIHSKNPHILPSYVLKDSRGHVVRGKKPRSELLVIPLPGKSGNTQPDEEGGQPPTPSKETAEPAPKQTRKSTRQQGEYEVDYISDTKRQKYRGKMSTFYLTHWVGYRDPTWEPQSNLTNAQDAIREFQEGRQQGA